MNIVDRTALNVAFNCPACESARLSVIDSRGSRGVRYGVRFAPPHRRRRYVCDECGHRFTTKETIEQEVEAWDPIVLGA